MTLQSAATLAFIGTLLASVWLIYEFVFDVLNVTQGLVPVVKLFPSLIYAFAALTLTIFFYIFRKRAD